MSKNKKKQRVHPLNEQLLTHAKEVFNDKEGKIPDDITRMSAESLRVAHSYWTSNYVYCSGQLSIVQRDIKVLEREREVRFKMKYIELKPRYTNEEARYRAELSKRVRRLDDAILDLQTQEDVWQTLTNQCEDLKKLCSRDQSYREVELQSYFGKGGRGK